MYHKRIVVDFDDTLAFHQNRKFNQALPNTKLIDKLNGLYDAGWQIDIFTARGSISCKTRGEASIKYRDDIIQWLDEHHVKYHNLSFDKPLAAYYIDDKGIMPEDFLKVDIRDLEGGLSGSEIYTDGKVVHKQDANAHNTKQWFLAAEGIATPQIHRIVGDTITMDYIDHDEFYFDTDYYMALAIVQSKLDLMKHRWPLDDLKYESYIERIRGHATASGEWVLMENCDSLKDYNLTRTFSHGDFGIKNMLFNNHDMTLIDPITDVFGCTEIDVAKFIASLLINGHEIGDTFKYFSLFNGINRDMLEVLIISELTRVYKYHPNKEFIMECVSHVYEYC